MFAYKLCIAIDQEKTYARFLFKIHTWPALLMPFLKGDLHSVKIKHISGRSNLYVIT